MSLIHDCREIQKAIASMAQKAEGQQRVYFNLIQGLVRLQQKHRVAQNYAFSDELHALLTSVNIKVTQGTAGYAYTEIPKELKGRPVDDQWHVEKEGSEYAA